jgi:hypothetical protein
MKALYFAYGLSLEEHSMVDNYPSARFYKFALIKGFKLIFSNKSEGEIGFCSMVAGKMDDYLEGVLYTVDHWELPEPFEGCSCSVMDVMCDNGEYVTAHVYYTENKNLVAPEEEYLWRVLKKYQDYGFNTKAIENALDKSNY